MARIAKDLQAATEKVHRLKDDDGDLMDCAMDVLAEVQFRPAEAESERDAHKETRDQLKSEIATLGKFQPGFRNGMIRRRSKGFGSTIQAPVSLPEKSMNALTEIG